jgi:hypothetical protein
VMLMMPIVGFLVSRVDPRWMIVYGFTISSWALFTMLNLNLGASYGYVAWLRVFQAAGLAFLFIPINTLSYNGIPMTKNNDVSGLTNLARNIGGSVGTAFVVTMLARRQQFHQNRLGTWISQSSCNVQNQVDSLAGGAWREGRLAGPGQSAGPGQHLLSVFAPVHDAGLSRCHQGSGGGNDDGHSASVLDEAAAEAQGRPGRALSQPGGGTYDKTLMVVR